MVCIRLWLGGVMVCIRLIFGGEEGVAEVDLGLAGVFREGGVVDASEGAGPGC